MVIATTESTLGCFATFGFCIGFLLFSQSCGSDFIDCLFALGIPCAPLTRFCEPMSVSHRDALIVCPSLWSMNPVVWINQRDLELWKMCPIVLGFVASWYDVFVRVAVRTSSTWFSSLFNFLILALFFLTRSLFFFFFICLTSFFLFTIQSYKSNIFMFFDNNLVKIIIISNIHIKN